MGGGGGGGGDSRRRTRDAVCSDWARSLSIDALVVDFQASSPESLSSTLVSATSNPSNFFTRSSMDVVIRASNLLGFRRGARSEGTHNLGEKFGGKGSDTNCYGLKYLERRNEGIRLEIGEGSGKEEEELGNGVRCICLFCSCRYREGWRQLYTAASSDDARWAYMGLGPIINRYNPGRSPVALPI